MATCLCDAFFDDVARATVEVLELAGCVVGFPPDQTCCGQPAFNAGDWAASRKVLRHCAEVFEGTDAVVVPSGSCAAMLFHGAHLATERGTPAEREAAEDLGKRTWELGDFLVNGLGIRSWGGRYARRVAYHRSCHSRGTDSGTAAAQLLGSIEGLELVPFGEGEQCCGFGGAFSVSFPNVSAAMGKMKLEHVVAARPDELVSSDMGCLLHLGGLLDKGGAPLPRRHLAQVLIDARRGA